MNIQPDNVCLVLTATIIPNTKQVAVSGVNERRNHYLQALRFYREKFSGSIYFLENSSYDFSQDAEFQRLFQQNITLVKFSFVDSDDKGKGYMEFRMLDEFFNHHKPKENYFLKITGRYLVKNFNQLIPALYYKIIADAHKKMKVTLTGVFFCSIDDYLKNISGLYNKANDKEGKYIEHVLYENLTLNGKTRLFNVNPVIEGVSGSYGDSLKRNPLKMKVRQVERKLLNTLKINQFLIEY